MITLQDKQVEENIIVCQNDTERILDLIGLIVSNRDSLGNVDVSDPKLAKFKDYLNSEGVIISKLQESVLKLTMIEMNYIYEEIERLNEYKSNIKLKFAGEKTLIDKNKASLVKEILVSIFNNICSNYIENQNEYADISIDISSFAQEGFVYLIIEEDKNLKISQEILDSLKEKLLKVKGNLFTNINELNNSIINISIPLNQSIRKMLFVNAGEETFAIPSGYINTIISRKSTDIKTSNGNKVLIYMDKVIQYKGLNDIMDIKDTKDSENYILIIKYQDKHMALGVDSLRGQRDTSLKKLGSKFANLTCFDGAVFMEEGKIALVLNIPELLKFNN